MSDTEIMGHVDKQAGERELNEMIEHWVTVIERWVADHGLGEASGSGAPGSGTGAPTDPEPGAYS